MTAWRFLFPSYLPLALLAVIASAKTVTIFIVAVVGKAAVVHLEELNNTTPTASTSQHFQNRDGSWRVREDVMIQFNNLHGGLTVGYGLDETRFGVELQFGHTVGDALRDDVFLIKCARGAISVFLAVNWRPPASGDANYTNCKNAQECRPYRPLEYGVNYRETVARILDTINTLQSLHPSWSIGDGLVSRLRRRRQCTKD